MPYSYNYLLGIGHCFLFQIKVLLLYCILHCNSKDMSLKIIVLAKQVPDTRYVGKDAMTPEGTVNRAVLPAIVNPDDMHALEQALRLKEKHPGSTVGVVTMGPPQAAEVIRQALYRGADTGWLLTDRRFGGADTIATSYVLSQALKQIGGVDVVFCGRQAIDGDTAQVGPQVAEKMGYWLVTYAEEVLESTENSLTIRRQIDGGMETVAAPMPLVVTVNGTAAPCRPANAKRVMTYKRATCPIERTEEDAYSYLYDERPYLTLTQWTAEDIGAKPELCGVAGSPTRVKSVQDIVFQTKETKVVEASEENVAKVIKELLDKKVI